MNKLVSFTGGLLNFSIDEVLFNDDAIRLALQEIFRAFGDNYIIQGVTGTTSITAGYIMLDGELLQVDAHTKTNTHFAKVTTYDPLGNITFNDGVARQTWQKNRATISASSGILAYANAKRLNQVINDLIFNDFTARKIINIGDWNMDTAGNVNVPLPAELSGAIIYGYQAFIRTDPIATTEYLYQINHLHAGNVSGAIKYDKDNTQFVLERLIGGLFDSSDFNDTGGYSRGFIIVEFFK